MRSTRSPTSKGAGLPSGTFHGRVHERGLRPETVAERYNLDLADVYRALAYYHGHPEEMAAVEERLEPAIDVAREQSDMTPPSE